MRGGVIMMKRVVLTLLLAATASPTCWQTSAEAQDAPRGDAAKGTQLYMRDGCSYCHGTVGQGGGGRTGGLRLAQMPIPFAAFLNQLRHPANEMPPYVAAVLSDQEAADIFAYIAGLPPPPDLKTIPALND
jgi:mono/diheme cytochrome c family protein